MVLLRVKSPEGQFRVTVSSKETMRDEIAAALKLTGASFNLALDKAGKNPFNEAQPLM